MRSICCEDEGYISILLIVNPFGVGIYEDRLPRALPGAIHRSSPSGLEGRIMPHSGFTGQDADTH